MCLFLMDICICIRAACQAAACFACLLCSLRVTCLPLLRGGCGQTHPCAPARPRVLCAACHPACAGLGASAAIPCKVMRHAGGGVGASGGGGDERRRRCCCPLGLVVPRLFLPGPGPGVPQACYDAVAHTGTHPAGLCVRCLWLWCGGICTSGGQHIVGARATPACGGVPL